MSISQKDHGDVSSDHTPPRLSSPDADERTSNCRISKFNMNTIHDIAVFVAIFTSGMLAGYLMKVAMVNKKGKKDGINI